MLKSADVAELRALRQQGETIWLDLENPDPGTVQSVGEALELHELAVEDTKEFGQRPKIDTYEDQLLMVYFGASLQDDEVPVPVEVHLHVGPGYVVSVHRGPCQKFEQVRRVLQADPPSSAELLIYRVIDALTDSLLDVLEDVASRVEDHEAEIFRRPKAVERDRMAILRRALGSLRRVLVIQRQMFDRAVERRDPRLIRDADLGSYYRDVADHLWRAVDETEAARDSLQGLLDTYTNEVQERLTIVATIFLPLTVITGFFGQNFNWMINHIGAAWAFWGLGIGGLLVSAGGISFWLVRSGLYHGRGPRSPRGRRT